MTREHRAQLAVACLIHLGVPEDDAHDLLAIALDEDPFAGVERVLLAIRQRCRQELDADARTLAEARELVGQLSLLADELRRIHREQERGTVLPLTARAAAPRRSP